MGRSKTNNFTVELPLWASSKQIKKALARFEAGRQIYNACLGEALKRRDQMLRSKMYRTAQAMPRNTREEIRTRVEAFSKARRKYADRSWVRVGGRRDNRALRGGAQNAK